MIPEKEDFKSLPHLGHQDQTSRNPQERMNLRTAKELLVQFTEIVPKSSFTPNTKKSYTEKET